MTDLRGPEYGEHHQQPAIQREQDQAAATKTDKPVPGKSAAKDELVDYAVDPGGMDRAEAEKLTKDELIARFPSER